MNNIAIIPARSGSKGLVDKNIKELCGKPLMGHSIEAAIQSGKFDEVMVSTDSERYAQIAIECGANVPFLRSEKMSQDTTTTWDSVKEVLANYRTLGREFDTFCVLQPTSPLRTAENIRGAYNIFEDRSAFGVISVCEAEHSPLWSGQLPENGSLDGFISKEKMLNRQALGKYYRLNGAIYILDVKRFLEDDYLYREGCYAYLMKAEHSVDIDNELDFKFAELLMSM